MHFFLAAMGSAGDVFPFIAVGRELRRRGHAVDVQASPWFATRIEGAGLGFVAAGNPGDYERLVDRPELWDPRRGFELLIETLLAGLPAVREQALERLTPATVLVGSTLAWHLRLLQETHGNLGATLHLSPTCIVSGDAPAALPLVGDLAWLPAALRRALQRAAERFLLDPAIRRGLDPVRAELHLAPVDRVMSRWIHSPDLVVAAWPDWFAPAQADWPARSSTTGFPMWHRDAPEDPDPALERFLQAGPKPVGITPGSAMAHAGDFFAHAVGACTALGQRALLVTPYHDQLPTGLAPERFHWVAAAPFERLVPRLAALVHHGGIGTSAQAFAAGVPQLVGPFAHDQFDNAARVERLGAGRCVVPGSRPGRWAAALAALVDARGSVQRRCCELAERIAAAPNAAEQIADRLETLGAGVATRSDAARRP